MLNTAELTERKSRRISSKRPREKSFQRDCRKYVSIPVKYKEFKRQDRQRKAVKKASEIAAYAKETLSSSISSSFKHYETKAQSLEKVESALRNSPRKRQAWPVNSTCA